MTSTVSSPATVPSTVDQSAWSIAEAKAAKVEAAAREAGFLVNAVQPDAIRLAPPLIITADEVASFVTALPEILRKA